MTEHAAREEDARLDREVEQRGSMTAALYREFTLKNGGVWNAVVAFIKANAPSFADKGEPLRLIVTAEERQRNVQQNRFTGAPCSSR
jgi:hypothetical protein